MMKVRQKHGFHASPREIDVLLCIVNATKMDESWFGEIREAKAQDGRTVHVVRDRGAQSQELGDMDTVRVRNGPGAEVGRGTSQVPVSRQKDREGSR